MQISWLRYGSGRVWVFLLMWILLGGLNWDEQLTTSIFTSGASLTVQQALESDVDETRLKVFPGLIVLSGICASLIYKVYPEHFRAHSSRLPKPSSSLYLLFSTYRI